MQPGEKHIFPLCIASLHFCCPFPSDSSHDLTNIAWQSHSPCRGNAGGVYSLASYPWAELNSAVLAKFSHALISIWLTLAIHGKGHQETVTRDITPVIPSLDCPFTEPIPLPCMLETLSAHDPVEEGCGISPLLPYKHTWGWLFKVSTNTLHTWLNYSPSNSLAFLIIY